MYEVVRVFVCVYMNVWVLVCFYLFVCMNLHLWGKKSFVYELVISECMCVCLFVCLFVCLVFFWFFV